MTRILFILVLVAFAVVDGVVRADSAIAMTDEIASLQGGNTPKAVNDPNEVAIGSGWWWLEVIIPAIPVAVLALLTGVYVWHTRTIALATLEQARLMVNPIVLAEPHGWEVATDAPGEMAVGVVVVNNGNAPAFGILLDGEIVLGARLGMTQETVLAREEPHSVVRTLGVGEHLAAFGKQGLVFGKACVERLLDECREAGPVPDEGYGLPLRSKIRIIVYYWNNLGQHYACRDEGIIRITKLRGEQGEKEYCLRDYRAVITHSKISKREMEKEITARNRKRHVNN